MVTLSATQQESVAIRLCITVATREIFKLFYYMKIAQYTKQLDLSSSFQIVSLFTLNWFLFLSTPLWTF